ncbi:MAG: hypothetical protein OEY29_03655 [Gammaproteobacteria bacterium]|nr:hypothetical protein [Gammaproteobacteria bacterium]
MTDIPRSPLLFYSFSILFRVLLDVSYYFVISDLFNYEGYAYDFTIEQYFISWVLYLAAFVIVNWQLTKVSDYFFVTALLSVVAPITSLYGLDFERPIFPVVITVMSIYLVHFVARIKMISFEDAPTVKYGREIAIVVSFGFVVFLTVWYFISGVKLNIDLSRIYDFRYGNAEISTFGVLAYTNTWTFKIFNIFLMVFSLFYKRYYLFAILVLVQTYFFAASNHKTIFLLPFVVLGVWFYFRQTKSLIVVPIIYSVIILLTLISYFLYNDIWLTTLFSRRVFYVPAQLTFVYFDFFSMNAHVFWSNSILSKLLVYPYDLGVAQVVGRYLGNEYMSANNGYISSGYANAGLYGVFLYSVIIGIILRFINDISYNELPVWLAVALTIVPLRDLLISSDLLTVMLTHGLLVAIILMYLSRKES